MQSALHKSIIEAMVELDESVLVEERNRPDIAPLIAEIIAERIAADQSSSDKSKSADGGDNESDLITGNTKKSKI